MSNITAGLFTLSLVLFGLGALAGWLLPGRDVRTRVSFGLAALAAALLIPAGVLAVAGQTAAYAIADWSALGVAGFNLDQLAGFFVFLTGIVGLALGIYSPAYLRRYGGRYSTRAMGALFNLLLLSVLVIVVADNGFLFLVAWETMSVALYLLVTYEYDRPGIPEAAYLTLAVTKAAAAGLIAGFLLLFAVSGDFSFASFQVHGPQAAPALRDAVFVLMLIGFGAKVAMVPLHVWLPQGYPASPSNVTAILAGIVLNTGFYGLYRVYFSFLGMPPSWWGIVVLLIGAVTGFTGIVYGLTRDDLKQFVAYSSVEHVGIMLIGLGTAMLGLTNHLPLLVGAGLIASTFHLFQHAISKALLFSGAGCLEVGTGTTAMGKLGGVARVMPWTAATFLAGSLSLAAMPPFGGFASEWLTFEALMQGFRLGTVTERIAMALAGALLALTAGLAVLAFVKVLGITFLGISRSRQVDEAREAPRSMVWPATFLAALALAAGVGAPWLVQLLGLAVAGLAGGNFAGNMVVWPNLALQPAFADFSSLSPTELAVALPIFFGVAIALILRLRARDYRERTVPVWTSASLEYGPDVTYTPMAYSNPMRVIFTTFYRYTRATSPVGESARFPRALEYRSEVVLLAERYLYQPATRVFLRVSSLFRRLQAGYLSLYLLYLLLVFIAILAAYTAIAR
jgi:hydrogenase-4 component B